VNQRGSNEAAQSHRFQKGEQMTTKRKILVLVSSGHGLPLKDGKVYAGAGYYLNELTVPVRALMKEGYEITFANPKGNTPQMDVNSAIAQFFGGDEAKLQDYLKFRESLTGLKNLTRISDVIAWASINMTLFSSPAAMAR
jgi:putative intracellular protease/amidase